MEYKTETINVPGTVKAIRLFILMLCLVVTVLSACRGERSSGPIPKQAFLWQREWTPAVIEAIVAADRFYKALVKRCEKTELGRETERIKWFPRVKGSDSGEGSQGVRQ